MARKDGVFLAAKGSAFGVRPSGMSSRYRYARNMEWMQINSSASSRVTYHGRHGAMEILVTDDISAKLDTNPRLLMIRFHGVDGVVVMFRSSSAAREALAMLERYAG